MLPRHLNNHLDYSVRPAPASDKAKSLATPLGMAFSPDANTLYVAAFGSKKIGVFSTSEIDNDTFTPNAADHIQLSGAGGPDRPGGAGRSHLRADALRRLGEGDRSFHQGRAADAGAAQPGAAERDPAAVPSSTTPWRRAATARPPARAATSSATWTTWPGTSATRTTTRSPTTTASSPRGPRPLRAPALRLPPHEGPDDDAEPAGPGEHGAAALAGRPRGRRGVLLQRLQRGLPGPGGARRRSSPRRRCRRSPTSRCSSATRRTRSGSSTTRCAPTRRRARCSTTSPPRTSWPAATTATRSLLRDGFFGSAGLSTFDGETQHFKVPHLRNVYQKIGMFGLSPSPIRRSFRSFRGSSSFPSMDPTTTRGPQIRGFGLLHDGSIDTPFRFLSAGLFQLNDTEQDQLEAFVMAFADRPGADRRPAGDAHQRQQRRPWTRAST